MTTLAVGQSEDCYDNTLNTMYSDKTLSKTTTRKGLQNLKLAKGAAV